MKFPIEAFPSAFQEACAAVKANTNAPEVMTTSIMLGVAALAAQGATNTQAHRFECASSLSILIIMKSTGLKSELLKKFQRGIKRYEECLETKYKTDLAKWKAEHRHWTAELKQIEKGTNIQAEIEHLSEEPAAPFRPQRIHGEATVVGLFRMFEQCGPSLGLFTDEAANLLHNHSMSDASSAYSMVSKLSDLHSGSKITRQTGDEQKTLQDLRLTNLWLGQMGMVQSFLNNPKFESQGILSRLIVVEAPEFKTTAPIFASDPELHKELRDKEDAALQAFNKRIFEILKQPVSIENLGTLPWSEKAKVLHETFVTDFAEPRRNGEVSNVETRSFHGRLEENAARIATILAVFDGAPCVYLEHANCAHEYMKYVTPLREAMDTTEADDTPENRAYTALEKWLSKHSGSTFSQRDALRKSPNAFRKADLKHRQSAIKRAQEDQLLEISEQASGVGRPATVWEIA